MKLIQAVSVGVLGMSLWAVAAEPATAPASGLRAGLIEAAREYGQPAERLVVAGRAIKGEDCAVLGDTWLLGDLPRVGPSPTMERLAQLRPEPACVSVVKADDERPGRGSHLPSPLPEAKRLLADADPVVRGTAARLLCRYREEVLADPEYITALGSLLNDEGKVCMGIAPPRVTQQQARVGEPDTKFASVTVGGWARLALACATGLDFADKPSFSMWNKSRGPVEKGLWYWRLAISGNPADAKARLAKLEPAEALKVVALAPCELAVIAQATGGQAECKVSSAGFMGGVDTQIVAAVLARPGVRDEAWAQLLGEKVWPELAKLPGPGVSWQKLSAYSRFIDVLAPALEKGDTPRFREVVTSPKFVLAGDRHLRDRAVLSAAALDPDTAVSWLGDWLKKNPSVAVASELIRRAGSPSWDTVKESYWQAGSGGYPVLEAIAAQPKTEGIARILREIMARQDFSVGIGDRMLRDEAGNGLVKAVAALADKRWPQAAIPKEMVEAAMTHAGKISHAEWQKLNAGVPEARQRLVKAIKALLADAGD